MSQIKSAFCLVLLLTIITGLIYPLLVTGVSYIFFPWQARGSLIIDNGRILGSHLIGQSFTSVNYFWGRPSATPDYPYNALASSGSNRGPSDRSFLEEVGRRVQEIRSLSESPGNLVPVDLVTASGSGLDPEISPMAAYYQVPRIANARHLSINEINILIKNNIKSRTFGILGEPRVNVLLLNIALDKYHSI